MQRDISISVGTFYEAASKELELEIVEGKEYLSRTIPEAAMNRPGLALVGFFQYFANKRIQVFGLAELSYLKSLPSDERESRILQLFASRIPAVVVTRNRHVPKEILQASHAAHVPVLKTKMITMDFVNAGTVMMEDLVSPEDRVHGTMVDIMGIGVLIQGEPGIGKSETALALIERGHSLVADDLTVLKRERSGPVMATAVEVTKYHMEIRGLGIIHVPSLFGVAAMRMRMKLDLIVHLKYMDSDDELDRTGLTAETRMVLGAEIPLVTLPVAAGRDISLIIEAAALNQKLKLLGHDAAKELDEKLIEILSKGAKVRR